MTVKPVFCLIVLSGTVSSFCSRARACTARSVRLFLMKSTSSGIALRMISLGPRPPFVMVSCQSSRILNIFPTKTRMVGVDIVLAKQGFALEKLCQIKQFSNKIGWRQHGVSLMQRITDDFVKLKYSKSICHKALNTFGTTHGIDVKSIKVGK